MKMGSFESPFVLVRFSCVGRASQATDCNGGTHVLPRSSMQELIAKNGFNNIALYNLGTLQGNFELWECSQVLLSCLVRYL